MPKKARFLVGAVLSALGFWLWVNLPYESRYYGLLAGAVLIMVCFWFGLGIMFNDDIYNRLMAVVLPVCLFAGTGLFATMMSLGRFGLAVLSVLFGVLVYALFLVENVFMVAIGFKTVPLYRAAYTVSLIVMLLTSFMLFNTVFSFGLPYWANLGLVFLLSGLIYLYQFWAVAIELPDDGKTKNKVVFVLVPAWLTAQMAMVLSFWPAGIFKTAVYLLTVVYILASLIQAEIRERLFRRDWLQYSWIGAAVMVGILVITNWRG